MKKKQTNYLCKYCKNQIEKEEKYLIERLHEIEVKRQFHECEMGPERCECENADRLLKYQFAHF